MEILMVTGLLSYIMNYIIGKNKNSRLAQAWFNSHRELLESNFALVGESFPLVVEPLTTLQDLLNVLYFVLCLIDIISM